MSLLPSPDEGLVFNLENKLPKRIIYPFLEHPLYYLSGHCNMWIMDLDKILFTYDPFVISNKRIAGIKWVNLAWYIHLMVIPNVYKK